MFKIDCSNSIFVVCAVFQMSSAMFDMVVDMAVLDPSRHRICNLKRMSFSASYWRYIEKYQICWGDISALKKADIWAMGLTGLMITGFVLGSVSMSHFAIYNRSWWIFFPNLIFSLRSQIRNLISPRFSPLKLNSEALKTSGDASKYNGDNDDRQC